MKTLLDIVRENWRFMIFFFPFPSLGLISQRRGNNHHTNFYLLFIAFSYVQRGKYYNDEFDGNVPFPDYEDSDKY